MEREKVIQAEFTGFKFKKLGNTLKLEFECPAVMAPKVFEIIGVPDSSESLWCAIAKLPNGNEN